MSRVSDGSEAFWWFPGGGQWLVAWWLFLGELIARSRDQKGQNVNPTVSGTHAAVAALSPAMFIELAMYPRKDPRDGD